MTLYAISKVIRSYGQLWFCQSQPYGFTFRATISNKSFRVVVPLPGGESVVVPEEKNVPTHIYRDLEELKRWLLTFLKSTL